MPLLHVVPWAPQNMQCRNPDWTRTNLLPGRNPPKKKSRFRQHEEPPFFFRCVYFTETTKPFSALLTDWPGRGRERVTRHDTERSPQEESTEEKVAHQHETKLFFCGSWSKICKQRAFSPSGWWGMEKCHKIDGLGVPQLIFEPLC